MSHTTNRNTPKPPIMGWSSWNALGGSIDEESILAQIDAMVETGLAAAGYEYINIDDLWQNGRDPVTGRVRYNAEKFPHGMKYLADYAHARGLKMGIYSDGGDNTCASSSGKRPYGRGVGLYRHEEDLWMYMGDGMYRDPYARNHPDDPGVECWGYDFIKVDWCGGRDHSLDAEERFSCYDRIIREIETETGKEKNFNLCCWGYYGPWMLRVGDSWRCGGDIDMSGRSFPSVLNCIDSMKRNGRFSLPGHYADPDMLVVGKHLTQAEDRSHFAMWCMFSVPLVMGCDLRTIRPETVELVTNRELIALNRDPLAKCAVCLQTLGENTELWFKKTVDYGSGDGAVALLNRGDEAETVTLRFADLCENGRAEMRDLLRHTDMGCAESITLTVAPHDVEILKIFTEDGFVSTDFAAVREDEVEMPTANPECISPYTVRQYLDEYDALLIDVRTREEYEAYHLPGTIHIEYWRLVSATDVLPRDPLAHLIVYCSGGKRTAQAFYELKKMKYRNVYCLSSMDEYRALYDAPIPAEN